MSPRSPQQFARIREERKQQILDAALHTFAEDSFHGASMASVAQKTGLKEPEFIQDDSFRTIIYRPIKQANDQVAGEVRKVLMVLNREMKRSEIQEVLQLKHDDYSGLNI